jgi:translation initiation factor IF-2
MSGETIKQLAQSMKVPVDRLLTQLGQAGMSFSDPEQIISSTEKMKLLGFLRRSHGKDAPAEGESASPRQITLKRSTRGELKLSTPGGRGAASGGAKTVNVEVRAKRTYVKRSVIAEEASSDVEREDAVRKLQESQQQRDHEENDRLEADRRRQEEAQRAEEAQRQREAEEEQRRQQAEAEAAARAKEHEERQAAIETDTAASQPESAPAAAQPASAEVAEKQAPAEQAVQRIDHSALGMIVPRIHEPRRREKKVVVVAPPAPAPAPAAPVRAVGGPVQLLRPRRLLPLRLAIRRAIPARRTKAPAASVLRRANCI